MVINKQSNKLNAQNNDFFTKNTLLHTRVVQIFGQMLINYVLYTWSLQCYCVAKNKTCIRREQYFYFVIYLHHILIFCVHKRKHSS